jgi:hypothetical protein
MILMGIPGKPPPEPISRILPSRFTARRIERESIKCLTIMASSSRIAERFV